MKKILFALLTASALPVAAQLNIICSMQADGCNLAKAEFEKATGIKVSMANKSSGETYAQLKAEAANPKVDLWYGGTGDPHLQAAEENLSLEYKSPLFDQQHNWSQYQAQVAGFKTIGIYAGALGYGYNSELMKKKNLPAPKCWSDLANPNSSGTAYTALATLVQIMGEDKAFAYLKDLHKNVTQYTKSGAAPIKSAARGENALGIVFIHDVVGEKVAGFPVVSVAPCEGTGYEVGSMTLVKGAKNLDNAKKFYDWALTPAAQELQAKAKQYQLPSSKLAAQAPEAPRFADVKLIQYDFKKYGASTERKRLLDKWEKEINSLPR